MADAIRFIPARAGNSHKASSASTRTAVHPRTSGEQQSPLTSAIARSGSSPHERGTEGLAVATINRRRFIPARAGNRQIQALCCPAPSVHPRTSGEQRRTGLSCAPGTGSSPHERGTVGKRVDAAIRGRFIPARAGNRAAPRTPRPAPAVHPRTSGEQQTRQEFRP